MRYAPPLIITTRLVGRRVIPDDLPELVTHFADPRVAATLGGVKTAEATAAWLKRELTQWINGRVGYYLFRDRGTRVMVGLCGLRRIRLEGKNEIELGYSVVAERWRQGLASEMGRALVAMGEGELAAEGIIAFTLPWNVGSRGTMERLGFTFEKVIRHSGLPHVLYRRLSPAI